MFQIRILPRQNMSREEFLVNTSQNSIALDGVVDGGPFYDAKTYHVNFDHHGGVVREATMSTAMQVYMAIKGGMMEVFGKGGKEISIYINDTDQDTVLAVWLLLNYKYFENNQSIPHINRLLALTDRLDITGGAFPMNLDERLIRQHCWIFEPYAKLRKSGQLYQASEEILRDNLDAVLSRLDKFLMHRGGEVELDIRHEILYDCPYFKIIDEIGGNDARYHLFSKGLKAFMSIVEKRPDGKVVYVIGRRSQFIPFPVLQLYDDFNRDEGLTRQNGWSGSDIIGGIRVGSKLTWQTLRDVALTCLAKENCL